MAHSDALDYELIDSGNYRKLERFGEIILDRPEIEAKWKPLSNKGEWEQAHWRFIEKKGKTGVWINQNQAVNEWFINYRYQGLSLKFNLKLTAFKHIGLFPEQAENWKYIQQKLSAIEKDKKVLNLFAYTGAASIVAAKCGATVSNVDSVKQVLNWGRDNALTNEVNSIRWILEDARKFVQKSLRRGDKYHGIIMDPPAFGYGAKSEEWKLERDLKTLLEQSIQLLDKEHSFFILNTYSPKLSLSSLRLLLKSVADFPKQVEISTLGLCSKKQQALILGNLVRFMH